MTTTPTTTQEEMDLAEAEEAFLAGRKVEIPGFGGVTIRQLPAADLTEEQRLEVLDLLRLAFNGGPSWFEIGVEPNDHLEWKLLDFPNKVSAYLMEDGDRIVGFIARPDRWWLVRGEQRIGRDGVELALHPEFQGRGFMSARRGLLKRPDGSDFSLSFSSHPASIHAREARGAKPLATPLDNLVKPLSVWRYVKPRTSPPAAPEGASRTRIALEARSDKKPKPVMVRRLGWWGRMLRNRVKYRGRSFAKPSWTVRTLDRFDERIDQLFTKASSEFDLIQVRDARFLNWRYTDRRAGPFTVRVAEKDGEILGYAVVRATEAGADIADFLVLPGRLDVAQSLIRDAVALARRAKSPGIRTWMTRGHAYYDLFQHMGFLAVRNIVSPGYTARGVPPEEIEFFDDPRARIHLMLGDSDHI